jgi:hypothetical protein
MTLYTIVKFVHFETKLILLMMIRESETALWNGIFFPANMQQEGCPPTGWRY